MTERVTLEEATANLERIREQYKDDPELLSIYEPAALWAVEICLRRSSAL